MNSNQDGGAQAGGYGPAQGGGYGQGGAPPPNDLLTKAKAFIATTPGKVVAVFGALLFLGMCSSVLKGGKQTSGGSSKEASEEVCRNGSSFTDSDKAKKLANCMAECSSGAKWACDMAQTLKPEANGPKESEAAKECRGYGSDGHKFANCTAACAEGAKWACDVATTLKEAIKTPPPSEAKPAATTAVSASDRVDDKEAAPERKVPDVAVAAAPVGGTRGAFPGIVQKFIDMNDLQKEAYAATFKGVVLSGSGEVTEVEKCGFLDDSTKWGDDCVKVILDSGIPRVALYYGDKDKSKVSGYSKGTNVSFSNCVANSIKDWGFWSTATCDMP